MTKQITNQCRISFKGTTTKELLYVILEFVDDLKQRGYSYEKHNRTDLSDDLIKIDYVLNKGA